MADPVPPEVKVKAAWSALSFVYGLAGAALAFLLGLNKLRKIVPITKEDFLEHVKAVNTRFQAIENKFEDKLLHLQQETKSSNDKILAEIQGLREDRSAMRAVGEERAREFTRMERRMDDFLTKFIGS